MGTYNPYFQSNLQVNECPICGKARPLDWFGREVKEDVRDQRTGKVVGVRRRREFNECWKCRELAWMRKEDQKNEGVDDDLLIG